MKTNEIILATLVCTGGLCQPASAAVTTTTCDPFGTLSVAGGSYIVQNNFFNPANNGTQCITVDSTTGAFSTSGNNFVPTNGAPSGYPSIYKGCHWGGCTTNSGLPLQLSQISSAPSSWNVTPVSGGNWDVAYDIWFNQTPTTTGQPDGTEIMIWINHGGSVVPAGSRTGNATINGINFDVWTAPKGAAGFNTVWNIVSYVATQPVNSVSFDLKPFFNDSKSRNMLSDAWYLLDVEAGFEGWQNWSGITSNAFSVSFNSCGSNCNNVSINPNSWYTLSSQATGSCIDDAEYGIVNGSIVQQYSCNANGQANQEWQFQPTDSGYYRIVSRQAPSLVIDVDNFGKANASKLHLWNYVGGNNQQWMPVSLGNGYYKFVGRDSGRCIDVPGASASNGLQLQIWDCNGTGAQSFKLTPY